MGDVLKLGDIKYGMSNFSVQALLVEQNIYQKKNLQDYLQITIRDDTKVISFPMWEFNTDRDSEAIEVGKVYAIRVSGATIYNGEIQLKINSVSCFSEIEDADINSYMPGFEITNEMENFFAKVISNLGKYQKLVAMCIKTIGKDNFCNSVAAVKHHHNKRHGLFYHTVGMLKLANKICDIYEESDDFNLARLNAKIILHDIGKVKEYDQMTGSYCEDFVLDHLSYGAVLIFNCNEKLHMDDKLSEEECNNIIYGILSHHGQYGAYKPKSIEDEILHQIDMIDSRLINQTVFENKNIIDKILE